VVLSKGFLPQKFIVQAPRVMQGTTGKPEVLKGVLFHQGGHFNPLKLVYAKLEAL